MERSEELAREILGMARGTLYLHLRFMDHAVGRLAGLEYPVEGIGTEGRYILFNSEHVLRVYAADERLVTRMYLHTVMHCVFQHPFVSRNIRRDVWDLACDIAVESLLWDLALPCIDYDGRGLQAQVLQELRRQLSHMNAERIYRYFIDRKITDRQCSEMKTAFRMDDHEPWYRPSICLVQLAGKAGESADQEKEPLSDGSSVGEQQKHESGEQENNDDAPQQDGSGKGGAGGQSPASAEHEAQQQSSMQTMQQVQEEWKQISRRIMVDLERFSKGQGEETGNMLQDLRALHREKYDYAEFLRKFAVYGEVMRIDEDQFDYLFYTYGMSLYGDMPLVEPLEYKEVKRIREFVIAIDTSGSVSGALVQQFLQKTFNILKSQESFFSRVCIHIIQCDAEIKEDKVIHTQEEFDAYLRTMKLRGFGGTDFRPVFSYVEELIREKAFMNLRGLLYFTDGMGTYPTQPPPYKTAFVFIGDQYEDHKVPVWAIRLMLEPEDLEEENL